ncbi:class I SAM-dependent methyltransferase [Lapidilactobacillus bayanensis]
MKENKYDDAEFFAAYSKFPRSVDGLQAAGEWHEFKQLLPNFTDQRVLDIGCGFGWHCRYAADNGAQSVLGIDLSEKMLQVAAQKTNNPKVHYQQMAMEDLDFVPNSFDVVLSSLAFHYTPNFSDICRKINGCLTANGKFIFSVEHPVFTAEGHQDWVYDQQGNPKYWPVDHYFNEGQRDAIFLGQHVTKYHRTLTTYLNTLLQTGFNLTKIVEPMPAADLLATVPGMKDELRRPMMLLVAAEKTK